MFLLWPALKLNELAFTWCTQQEYKWPSLIGNKLEIRELCRPYLAFYPSLDIMLFE